MPSASEGTLQADPHPGVAPRTGPTPSSTA